MFGKNPVEHQIRDAGQILQIVKGSPFYTLQGEGPYAGHPAIFIRLHGCNLRCTFCDTNFSDPSDPMVPTKEIIDQVLWLTHLHPSTKLAVITGGEPMRQSIVPLCRWLWAGLDMKVQIETAGTLWLDGIDECAEIVCSPKTPSIHPEILRTAIAFKYVISVDQNFEDGFVPVTATQPGAFPKRLARPRRGAPVYLSPMDEGNLIRNAANRKLVRDMALREGCIAGVQLHKMLDIEEPS